MPLQIHSTVLNRLLIKYTGLLLLGFLLEWWLRIYSGFNIPKYIPGTPFNVSGLYLITLLLVILIIFNKKLLKISSTFSIIKHTLLSSLIIFLSEFFFQLLRSSTFEDYTLQERFREFLLGLVGMTIFASFISFFIAFQIKTKRTKILLIFIAIFLGLCLIIKNSFLQTPTV